MRILYIHNNYAGSNSGEEHAANSIAGLLIQNGHQVEWYRRSSDELTSATKKTGAFFTGIWNPVAVKQVKKKVIDVNPDVVIIQNLYPLISPAIIKTIKKAGIPIIMRCPNYRLFCPSGLHLNRKGEICEKCVLKGKEINCMLNNCENNMLKSAGYAIRNYAARTIWDIRNSVDIFIVQTPFQKEKFMDNGIPGSKIEILPGITPDIITTDTSEPKNRVTFVGRVSLEKGIVEFIEAARRLPEIRFVVAGTVDPSMVHLKQTGPKNVEWMGFLNREALDNLYEKSQMIVVPGKWYEGFPNVITRAMKHGKPVITSNLGAMASIIDHEENGLLVEPGNTIALTNAINDLYNQPEKCLRLGKNGREKAEKHFSQDAIYQTLITILNKSIAENTEKYKMA
ncbi:MAG: glycosyltransferase family 4 protein [Prolixibacteraceae bacterium]|nr:glycosyltransferase family 4 protein [Prolixibacteraceae bacterium]